MKKICSIQSLTSRLNIYVFIIKKNMEKSVLNRFNICTQVNLEHHAHNATLSSYVIELSKCTRVKTFTNPCQFNENEHLATSRFCSIIICFVHIHHMTLMCLTLFTQHITLIFLSITHKREMK